MGLLSNAKWVAFSQVFKIGVQLINIVVLARLIPPSEYGLMAMAIVVTNLAIIMRDLGTAAAIIQRKELTHRIINAIFWLNVIMGLLIALCMVLLSPIIASLFHEPRLIMILCLLAISFPIASTASAHLALLERDSSFKKIAGIEISSSLVSVVVAIILAYLNFGVYSLVVQVIFLSLMSTLQLWFGSKWRPDVIKIFDVQEIKKIMGFSGNLTIFNFINYFSRNADSMVIGHYFSASILGAYSLAYRLMLFPLQSLTFVVSRALFPLLSQQQNDLDGLRKMYLQTIYVILFLVTPLMSGLACLSVPFITIVFGPQWHLTSTILFWLAPTAIIQSVLSTSGTIFMARGRTDMLMKLGIFSTILMLLAFMIGAKLGIIEFAKIYFIANVINFFPVMYYVMRLIDGSIIDIIKKTYGVVLSSLAMVSLLLILKTHVFYFNNINNYSSLLLLIVIGAFFYCLVSFIITPTLFKDFKILLKNLYRKKLAKL